MPWVASKEIAKAIIQQEADYVLSLKANQGQLYEELKLFFDTGAQVGFGEIAVATHETLDADQGRGETRRYGITSALDGIVEQGQWVGLRVGRVESMCEVGGGKTRTERRYSISSLDAEAEQFGVAVSGPWGIENRLHGCLAVTFREDKRRVRKDNSPDNRAMLYHLTLNLLRQETTSK